MIVQDDFILYDIFDIKFNIHHGNVVLNDKLDETVFIALKCENIYKKIGDGEETVKVINAISGNVIIDGYSASYLFHQDIENSPFRYDFTDNNFNKGMITHNSLVAIKLINPFYTNPTQLNWFVGKLNGFEKKYELETIIIVSKFRKPFDIENEILKNIFTLPI